MLLATLKTTIGKVKTGFSVLMKEQMEEAAEELIKKPAFPARSVDEVPFTRKFYVQEKSATADLQPGQVRHWITTMAIDRDGEIMEPKGADLKHYRKNPMVLWGHDYMEPANIVGKNLLIDVEEHGLVALTQFDIKREKAALIYDLYKDGFLKAWSVGFIPVKGHAPKPENAPSMPPGIVMIDMRPPQPGELKYVHEKWALLEYSAVAVPANPEALTLSVAKGDLEMDDVLLKELALNVDFIRKKRADMGTRLKGSTIYIKGYKPKEKGEEEKQEGGGEAEKETPASGEGVGAADAGEPAGGGADGAGVSGKVNDDEGDPHSLSMMLKLDVSEAAAKLQALREETKALHLEIEGMKVGRVLSEKNRNLIRQTMESFQKAVLAMRDASSMVKASTQVLDDLLKATDTSAGKPEEDDENEPGKPRKPKPKPGSPNEGPQASPGQQSAGRGITFNVTKIVREVQNEIKPSGELKKIFEGLVDKATGRV